MIFGYTLLFIALLISSVAAFYSIMGLTAIFAAAFWPIVIMGAVLEIGKIAVLAVKEPGMVNVVEEFGGGSSSCSA